MENFIYYTPTKVFFGKEQEKNLGKILESYNIKKVLLHYGKSSIKKIGLYDTVINQLKASKIDFIELGGVEPNPKLNLVLKGVEICKNENIELILAVGGGSVLDSAKSISVGAKVDFNPWKFSIKEAEPKDHIPVGCILTIAASGSDMSNSCVITNDETLEKRGFTSDHNRCLFSILNPELTYSVDKYQTACGIVDIIMHTIERYISLGEENPLTDNISLGLIKAVINAGKIVIENPNNYNARATLLWANSLSHNGLTGCGRNYFMSVHQLEHEVSGMFDYVSHGAGLAVLWPAWAKYSYKAARTLFKRFAYEVMEIIPTSDLDADIEASIDKLKMFFKSIGMPTSFKELNITSKAFEALALNVVFKGKRILNDIVPIDYEQALEIYKMAE